MQWGTILAIYALMGGVSYQKVTALACGPTPSADQTATEMQCTPVQSLSATRSRASSYPLPTHEVVLQNCYPRTTKAVNDTLLLNYALKFCSSALQTYLEPHESHVQCFRDLHERLTYTFNITNNAKCPSGRIPCIPGAEAKSGYDKTRQDELENACQRIFWEAGSRCWTKNVGRGGTVTVECLDYSFRVV